MDERSFPRYFGGPLRRQSAQFDDAMDFAKQNGAVLVFATNPRVAKFGRTSVTRDDNAGIEEAHPGNDNKPGVELA